MFVCKRLYIVQPFLISTVKHSITNTNTMTKITSICVTAKCSDACNIQFFDENKTKVGERDDYVPNYFPEEHYGDYVELEIDIATGKILNWKKPTQKELKDSIQNS